MLRLLALAVGIALLLPILVIVMMMGAVASLAGGSCESGLTTVASGPASAGGMPAQLMPLYVGAAGKYGLGSEGWSILAAINSVETSFGRNLSTSSKGAVGWMQFEPATWTEYRVTPSGAPAPNDATGWDDPGDAIYTAAKFLEAVGAPGDWYGAIWSYNQADWYVTEIERLAAQFRSAANGQSTVNVSLTGATSTTGATGGSGGKLTVDPAAAITYANGLTGVAGFAVVTADGQVLAQYNSDVTVSGAAITRAMLLVAFLNGPGRAGVSWQADGRLSAMIEQGSERDANWVLSQVGTGAVLAVAHAAHMTNFQIDTSDAGRRLGNSQVSALDSARLFARIDQLMPASERPYGMGLLDEHPGERWGILDAGVGIGASTAGSKLQGDGWVVNQAGQLQAGGQTVGIAIVSEGIPHLAVGKQVMQTLAHDLLPGAQPAPGGSGGSSGCVPNGPSTPGTTATLQPNGLAAIPESAPLAVRQMLAAGNQIVTYPYVYGGGHDPQSMRVPPSPTGGGYDCSSSVSFVLWGAGLNLNQSLLGGQVPTSWTLESVGVPGAGQWVTIYAGTSGGEGHTFIEVDGLVLDTVHGSSTTPAGTGPRWQPSSEVQFELAHGSFTTRHPPGL